MIQVHTPVKLQSDNDLQTKWHNLIYNSFFYKLLVFMIAGNVQVLTENDKRFFISSTKLRIPCSENFFNSYLIPSGSKFKLPIKILIYSRLTYQKGIDFLPSIVQILKKEGESFNFEFNIYGTGEMEYIVKELSIANLNVHFFGNISQNDIPQVIKNNHIVLMLSRFEGSPQTIPESLAMGMPIIAFEVSGIEEERVIKVQPFDINQICKKLIEFKSWNEIKWINEYTNNRNKALKNYRMEIYCDKLLSLFKNKGKII